MPQGKKLLIISCSTGSGHFRAAEAIRLTCEKLYPDTQAVHVDMAQYLDGIAYLYVVSFYGFFSSLIPASYKLVYRLTDCWFIQKLFKVLAPFIRPGSRKLIAFIYSYQPDIILSTHFLPPLILPKKITAPIYTVITDYHAHKIWLPSRVRNFFVATEKIKADLKHYNIDCITSGIPIHPDFFEEKNTDELKSKFGIKNSSPIILIMPTAHGEIKTEKAIAKIIDYNFGKDLNFIAITGKNNEKTFNNLKNIQAAAQSGRAGGKNTFTIFKNVENIDELMRITDIIISKAGGLTISEAIYVQKPIIIINPIPGQEDYNTAYLEQNHYGLQAHSTYDLIQKIESVLANPSIINKKSCPNSSKIILENIFSDQ